MASVGGCTASVGFSLIQLPAWGRAPAMHCREGHGSSMTACNLSSLIIKWTADCYNPSTSAQLQVILAPDALKVGPPGSFWHLVAPKRATPKRPQRGGRHVGRAPSS
eukprot:6193622-Pleurochrysis_carterae.AAC.3